MGEREREIRRTLTNWSFRVEVSSLELLERKRKPSERIERRTEKREN